VCLDPYLGYTECYLRVALEIHRIDVYSPAPHVSNAQCTPDRDQETSTVPPHI